MRCKRAVMRLNCVTSFGTDDSHAHGGLRKSGGLHPGEREHVLEAVQRRLCKSPRPCGSVGRSNIPSAL
jgi:hypothetical protein